MSKKIKAILIEVSERQVREIEIETGLRPMYEILDCQTVERFPLDRKNCLWVDEEGALATPRADKFLIRGYPCIFTGNGLIYAHDGKGGDADTTLNAAHVRTLVRWAGAVHVEVQVPRFVPFAEIPQHITLP